MDPDMATQASATIDQDQVPGQDPERALLQPWYIPEGHFHEVPGIMCATDLLAVWEPEDVVAPGIQGDTAGAWDSFFSESAMALPTNAMQPPPSEPTNETWDPSAAAAAVECLFSFVHALERMDVDQAMRSVGPDFHTFEDNCDIDRDALRLQWERRIDEWRGPDLRITLTEIPDPVFHTLGVLIQATLQVDFRSSFHETMETALLSYLFVLDAQPRQAWLIRSMCRVG